MRIDPATKAKAEIAAAADGRSLSQWGMALIKVALKGNRQSDRARFEVFNSANGWGKYDHFIPFVEDYLKACVKWPEAAVSVWR